MTNLLDKDGQEEAISLLRCCETYASYICANTKEARPMTDDVWEKIVVAKNTLQEVLVDLFGVPNNGNDN